MKQRLLSLLVAFALLLGVCSPLFPVQANAASNLYWPVPGHTSLSRGYTSDHNALDIHDSYINGAPIVAAIGGTVHRIHLCPQQHYGSMHDCNGFGTGLVIKGDDGRYYTYAHMLANSIPANVYYGAYVQSGQQIGQVGTTGNSTGPHLHFAIASTSNWWVTDINPANLSYNYGQSSTEVAVNWQNHTQTPKTGDFYTYVEAVTNVSGVFTEAGIIVWNPHNNDQTVAQKVETPTSSVLSKLQIWYNVVEETGSSLTPGANYKYQIFVKFNGTYYYSPVYTIDIGGTHTHSYKGWEVTTPATCTKDGVESRPCIYCTKVDTRAIPALAHNWKAATCTAPKTCKNCGATSGTASHSYDHSYDYKCNVCGAVRNVDMTRPMVNMFRMYDPNSGEHFYTGSDIEKNNLIAAGWKYEGIGFTFPKTTGKPVHRLYDPATGEHLYTMDDKEKNTLLAQGWNYEGIAFNSGFENEVPQYRLHNPNANRGAYHFTASLEERDFLISIGWEYQGIGWYSLGG